MEVSMDSRSRWLGVAILVVLSGCSLSGSAAPAAIAPLILQSSSEKHAVVRAAPGSLETRILQQGLNGYSGVRDTWVSSQDWDTPPQHTVNYGQNQVLTLGRDDDDSPLIRFDVTGIPTNSAVLSATLSLYNTTPAGCDSAGTLPRRVRLFTVLADWNEGNRVASPVNQSGDHGATGDHAFSYYPGEGTDIPWSERGMAAGSDYASAAESHADVLNEGWYTWNVTDLVRSWVRGDLANYGLVLRDATSYQDGNCDWRAFFSSQHTTGSHASGALTPGLRPKLTIVYNPDVPFAHAGSDQENLSWDSSAVTLDGSGSYDRPGGHDASLTYAWRVVQEAYGSALAGHLISTAQAVAFTPDIAGEWEIELTVTNDAGESASDRVGLRLLSIAAGRPRIYLTPAKLAALQERAVPSNIRWTQLLGEADDSDGHMHAKALVSQVTGERSYCDTAISAALDLIAAPSDYSTKAGDIALVYDWCHADLAGSQRATFIDYFDAWGDDTPKSEDVPGWGNYWPRYGYSYALIGLASYGDSPRAQEWLDDYRHRRYGDNDLALLDRIAEGGAWPEGTVYDWIANWPRVKTLDAWRTATGENLFESTGWYRERLGYLLLQHWPGVAEEWGYQYHPYVSIGDGERNRGTMANYGRIMSLVLLEQFPNEPLAPQLQAYLSAQPTGNSDEFLYHEEFLWFNPDQAMQAPSLLTHYAPGSGTIFMRSGWPDGAADADLGATYLTFQSGDHFSYHQHYDQNSFTMFKHGDGSEGSARGLALDSGVYSGDGLADHDVNYYVRSIAHNTFVVYNPAEDFSSARPDAYSNDGGQRALYPASRSPQTVEYFDEHATHYDTGEILRFEDRPSYTYALGDATNAYNNPSYNQAMDTGLSGNVAKVNRYQREFVYLRPESAGLRDYLVLFDRVGVADPSFSGENTKLLFHTLNEPQVNGMPTTVSPGETVFTGADTATAISGDGKLFIRALLPLHRRIRVVGGRGVKSFWVFGDNYDWHWDPSEEQPRPTNDFEELPYGEWRLELEPATRSLENNFLTVLHPTSIGTASMAPVALVNGTGLTGAHIADPELNRVTLFSSTRDGSPAGGTLSYSYTPTARTLNLILDLAPGERYHLSSALGGGLLEVVLSPSPEGTYRASGQGTLEFVLEAGGSPQERRWTYLPLILKDRLALLPSRTPAATPVPTATSTPPVTATRTPLTVPTPTPTGTPAGSPSAGGHITYELEDGRVYRIAARAGAAPDDVSLALDDLGSGLEDSYLNISPDGQWLILSTDRFDPACVGWTCLALVAADLSMGEAIRSGGQPLRAEGFSAIGSLGTPPGGTPARGTTSRNGGPLLIVYPAGDGPAHGLDLWASVRGQEGWDVPVLLTGDSPYAYNDQPAISADGRMVLFDCSDVPYGQEGTAICEVGTDGAGFRVVLSPDQGPGGALQNAVRHPDYGPDGSIVFEADWNGAERIWRLPFGSSQAVAVSPQLTNDNSPCVLPDGCIASLWLNRPGGPGFHEIKITAPDGSNYIMALTGVDVADVGIGCGI